MDISKIKIAWKYITGGMGGVVDYLLDILNNALRSISAENKAKVQGALNLAEKVLATLNALQWLCPTKWQTAYRETVAAVLVVVDALSDLEITAAELTKVRDAFNAAVMAWKSSDDDTCVAL